MMKYVPPLVSITLALASNSRVAEAGKFSTKGGHQDQLFTPTLWAQSPDYFACNLTNLGNKPISATSSIYNGATGQLLLQDAVVGLAPYQTQDVTIEGLGDDGTPFFCAFEVPNKHDVRGAAKLWRGPDADNGSDFVIIAAT